MVGLPRTRLSRGLIALLAVLVGLGSTTWFLPPARTIVRSALLTYDLLGLPASPLALLPQPRRVTLSYGQPADRLDVYLPQDAGPARRLPAVVLELGVHTQPIDHPDIVRVAAAIARLGVVVGVPDSTGLRTLRVTPAEPAHLADALIEISERPEVDAGRLGLVGFSAGGSIALVAAADARIADRLRVIASFGGYADAERLLVDVATRSSVTEQGAIEAWTPDSGIRHDLLKLALAALDSDAERDQLQRVLAPVVGSEAPPSGPDQGVLSQLAGDGRPIYLLFTAPDRGAAEEAVASLSPGLRAQLAGISPVTVADAIHAPVFLLHGETDTAIPVAHAALLRDAIGEEVSRLTRFGQFGHEHPGQGGLSIDDAADIWELALYLRDIIAATTE